MNQVDRKAGKSFTRFSLESFSRVVQMKRRELCVALLYADGQLPQILVWLSFLIEARLANTKMLQSIPP